MPKGQTVCRAALAVGFGALAADRFDFIALEFPAMHRLVSACGRECPGFAGSEN